MPSLTRSHAISPGKKVHSFFKYHSAVTAVLPPVICEKVQSKLPWTKILHHTITFSCAMVFHEGTWIRSRQISAILLTHFATKLAISFIFHYELVHEGFYHLPPSTPVLTGKMSYGHLCH
jgi:hypothetical protein